LAERRRRVGETASDRRLAVRVVGEAVEVVSARLARRHAGVLDAAVARVAAELERRPAERAIVLARRRADHSVEAHLTGRAAEEAVVAAARVLADRRADEVVDALLAGAAARAPAAELFRGAAPAVLAG